MTCFCPCDRVSHGFFFKHCSRNKITCVQADRNPIYSKKSCFQKKNFNSQNYENASISKKLAFWRKNARNSKKHLKCFHFPEKNPKLLKNCAFELYHVCFFSCIVFKKKSRVHKPIETRFIPWTRAFTKKPFKPQNYEDASFSKEFAFWREKTRSFKHLQCFIFPQKTLLCYLFREKKKTCLREENLQTTNLGKRIICHENSETSECALFSQDFVVRVKWRNDKTVKMLHLVKHKILAKYTIFQGIRVFEGNRIISNTWKCFIFQGVYVFEKKAPLQLFEMLYFQEKCYAVADQN